MASVITHGVAGVILARIGYHRPLPARFWVLVVACSVLPDADVVLFALDLPHGHVFSHRGVSHSLVFAALIGVLVPTLFFRDTRPLTRAWWGLGACFFLVTASHGLLDAWTRAGRGIAFFWPFTDQRYFLPWRPLEAPPLDIAPFFSWWGVRILLKEVVWVWIPGLVVLWAVRAVVRAWPFRSSRDVP